ncbi:MAG TPA: YetF domain-containing protein, partial [Atopostipes sp.]|nr:YetF domain-containing protein [Atopostipes sp.]
MIYILLLGAVVEEAIYDDKVNVLHVLFAIVLWGLFVYVIEKALQHTDKFSTFIEGEPAILIEKGRLNLKELDANFFDIEQLRSMLRQNNVYSIADVYYAILEVNGNLTVIT